MDERNGERTFGGFPRSTHHEELVPSRMREPRRRERSRNALSSIHSRSDCLGNFVGRGLVGKMRLESPNWRASDRLIDAACSPMSAFPLPSLRSSAGKAAHLRRQRPRGQAQIGTVQGGRRRRPEVHGQGR